MSTYEANWEMGVLVTAEATSGIGFQAAEEHEAEEPAADEAAD